MIYTNGANFETLKLLYLMDMFADQMVQGHICAFSEATSEMKNEDRNYIFYDDQMPCGDGSTQYYPVVADSLIDPLHHDVISYYPCAFEDAADLDGLNYEILYGEDGDIPWIEIRESDGDGLFCIDSENGWYWVP